MAPAKGGLNAISWYIGVGTETMAFLALNRRLFLVVTRTSPLAPPVWRMEATGVDRRIDPGVIVEAIPSAYCWEPIEFVNENSCLALSYRISFRLTSCASQILSAMLCIRPHQLEAAATLAIMQEVQGTDFWPVDAQHGANPEIRIFQRLGKAARLTGKLLKRDGVERLASDPGTLDVD